MASHNGAVRAEGVVLTLRLSKDHLRKIELSEPDGQYVIYRLMPSVEDWPAGKVPDGPNPRSHDEECLRSGVAKAIRSTLLNAPQDFQLANRGGCLLAEALKYDPDREQATIILTDLEVHGMADGATSNKVIAEAQQEALETKDPEARAAILEALSRARFNVEVVVGLTDHDRIMSLVRGRNTSIQVRPWTLADFDHKFDWIKEIIDRAEGPFQDKVGWEENSGKEISVLDIISVMTLFHPIFDDVAERRRRAPTVAFASKGTSDRRLVDETMAPGYRQLANVLEDLLGLHDHIYVNFEPTYERYNKEVHNRGSKLGKRSGAKNSPITLPLTGRQSEYQIDKGLVFPLLASLRCLLKFDDGVASWRVDPNEFFEEFGPDLMGVLIEQYELCGRNPATTGKTKAVYAALHNQARLLLAESLHDAAATV